MVPGGCSDRGGARSGQTEGGFGATASQGKRWSLVGSVFRVLLSEFVRAILPWTRRFPVKRRWRVTGGLTLCLQIWRLVSPCRLEFQICKEGLSRSVGCSRSPPAQVNFGDSLWRHTEARAEDVCSPDFLSRCVYCIFRRP
ncbi:hypothetical protein Bca4012_025340 [Brassica carinata]